MFPQEWQKRLGEPDDLSDVAIWVPDEGAFPTRARKIREVGENVYTVDSWGRTNRSKKGAYFYETLEVPIPPGTDPDSVTFDSPTMDSRYLKGQHNFTDIEFSKNDERKRKYCVFGKTGGPYLRTSFVRGEAQFLMDLAGDPILAKALVDKMGDHLAAVGCEEIRRWGLQDTGMWIYDDMAYNDGPMFSPKTFERVLLPAYRKMIRMFREAGAKYVCLHSDGDIRPILDMLVDAGIEGINPVERRAGMNMDVIRKKHPRLILTGGMDNTDTLVNGPIDKIVAEAKDIIDLGTDGGVIIGTHSISPEIPLEHFAAYHETCQTYGSFG